MLSFTVRMRFDEADHAEVTEMLRELTLASRAEPGCVNYVSHFVEGDPTTVLIYEQYVDQAALDVHSNSEHFRRYAAQGFYKLMRAQQIERLDAVV
jgi:quinol monooxygenase YgiN